MEAIPPPEYVIALLDYIVKEAGNIIQGKSDERQTRKDIQESLEEAAKAFRACVPKGKTIPLEIFNAFFDSQVFKSQYQELLQGNEPNITYRSLVKNLHFP